MNLCHTGSVEHFDDNLQLSIGRHLSIFHVAHQNFLQTLDDKRHKPATDTQPLSLYS